MYLWVCFWAFYSVLLRALYFIIKLWCLITVVLWYSLKLESVMLPASLLFKITLTIWKLLWFHRNFKIVFSTSGKNVTAILARIAQITLSIVVESLSRLWLCVTLRTACQVPLSTISQSLLRFMFIELVMLSNPSILCLSLPFAVSLSQDQGISRESAFHLRWPKYWSVWILWIVSQY